MLDRWMPLMNKQTFMTPPWLFQESVDKRPFFEGESKVFNHVKNYNAFQSVCNVGDDNYEVDDEKPLHGYVAKGGSIMQHATRIFDDDSPPSAGPNHEVEREPVLNFPTTYNPADAVGRLYARRLRTRGLTQSSKKHKKRHGKK